MHKIGVICAMEMEREHLSGMLENKTEEKAGAFSFLCGSYGGKAVILGLSGIGKVNAALCAQALILRFAPDAIINSGVAGSLSPDLEILDIALSTALVQHDMDTSPLGDPVGWLSGPDRVEIPGDESLLRAAQTAAGDLGLHALPGIIASGDQFIATREQKERIITAFHPLACEMEGAAVAQAAWLHHTPVLVLRAISDSFSGKNEMDYARFAPQAAEQSARLLLRMLQLL